jgi:23S rRNA (uracil1939-C5)-methyltransferase
MLTPGDTHSLVIQKPVAGGRMLARLDGQVILVSGTIPGERVTARIEGLAKGVAYAQVVSIDEPSVDRREPFVDPLCGGCLYAYISYGRQRALKGEVIADAFARIGRITLVNDLEVVASRDEGYRMRARLHLRGGQSGFFREGSHDLCSARATRQLLAASCDTLDELTNAIRSIGTDAVRELELSENVDASERVVHLAATARIAPAQLARLAGTAGLTGLTVAGASGSVVIAGGDPVVTDVLSIGGRSVSLGRHGLAFFQGNRYLLTDLVARVIADIGDGERVLDLYAGVGLFAVSAAQIRGARVTAVEGDRATATDLIRNSAAASGADILPVHQSVEAFVRSRQRRPQTLIVDPPRTGMSRQALAGAVGLKARTIVYVSCDVATAARDARRFTDAGYSLRRLDAFDLFPNTPHVEIVATFER